MPSGAVASDSSRDASGEGCRPVHGNNAGTRCGRERQRPRGRDSTASSVRARRGRGSRECRLQHIRIPAYGEPMNGSKEQRLCSMSGSGSEMVLPGGRQGRAVTQAPVWVARERDGRRGIGTPIPRRVREGCSGVFDRRARLPKQATASRPVSPFRGVRTCEARERTRIRLVIRLQKYETPGAYAPGVRSVFDRCRGLPAWPRSMARRRRGIVVKRSPMTGGSSIDAWWREMRGISCQATG